MGANSNVDDDDQQYEREFEYSQSNQSGESRPIGARVLKHTGEYINSMLVIQDKISIGGN